MPGQGHQVHVLGVGQRHVPGGLDRIGVQEGAVGAGRLGERGDVLDGAGLVVHQRGAEHADTGVSQRLLDPVGPQHAAGVDGQLAQLERLGAV